MIIFVNYTNSKNENLELKIDIFDGIRKCHACALEGCKIVPLFSALFDPFLFIFLPLHTSCLSLFMSGICLGKWKHDAGSRARRRPLFNARSSFISCFSCAFVSLDRAHTYRVNLIWRRRRKLNGFIPSSSSSDKGSKNQFFSHVPYQ